MLKRILLSTVAAIALLVPATIPVAVYAATPNQDAVCAGIAATGGSCDTKTNGLTVNKIIQNIIDILSFVVGVVAVIAIIFAGLQFVTADGSTEKIAKARMAILYAIIGLVVVAVAQLIVVFVLKNLS